MWTVWGALVVCLAALYLYRMSLTRDEDDQIVLDDSFDNVKNQQAAIVAKVKKLEPVVRAFLGLVGFMTVVVIVYYVRDIMLQLGLIGH
jgi:nucleoside recognition membrane protein YjiH